MIRINPVMTLIEARESVGWSRAELARKAGLKDDDIYDLENERNKRPSWHTVFLITEALRGAGLVGLQPQQIFPIDRAA